MKNKFIIGGLALLFVVALIAGKWISVHNTEIEKRENVEAQQEVCQANFDKMHKVIAQIADVSSENMKQSKEAFKEIYPALMDSRYSNERGGALMSWVHEHNPQFDLNATSKLYSKLASAIESNREAFFIEQKKLISYKQEHDKYIAKFPNSMFLGSISEIDIITITSEKTKETYATGEENDIDLFSEED